MVPCGPVVDRALDEYRLRAERIAERIAERLLPAESKPVSCVPASPAGRFD
jgi:hypothetical protein